MDYIFIEDLKVRGKHGVMDIERKIEQEFALSLRMQFDTKAAAASDNLADTLDYQPIKEMIIKIVKENNFFLIEKLAETICKEILKDKRVAQIEFTVRKTAIWDNGIPGITITRP